VWLNLAKDAPGENEYLITIFGESHDCVLPLDLFVSGIDAAKKLVPIGEDATFEQPEEK